MGNANTDQTTVELFPRGYNGTMSYSVGGRPTLAYLRIRKLAYSWEVVATESHARSNRAMYPHQRAISRFAVTLELKGYTEYKNCMLFFKTYVDSMFGAERRSVFIGCPVRKFARWGIPVKGISAGDHVGSNVFMPEFVFESINDPQDQTVMTPESGNVSRTNLNGVTGDAAKFFFPFSQASRDPNTRAETYYDFDTSPVGFGEAINGALSNAIGNVQGAAGSAAQRAQDIIDDMRRNGQL